MGGRCLLSGALFYVLPILSLPYRPSPGSTSSSPLSARPQLCLSVRSFRLLTPVSSRSGHNVNGISPDDRLPDPERLLSAYFHSTATVNHVRSLLSSGFASLPTSKDQNVPWSLPLTHVRSPELLKSYEEIVRNLSEALEFMKVIGVEREAGGAAGTLDAADIWMSHEALMLEYESALTREQTIPSFAASRPGEKGF